ncbi:MAG: 5-formyltetrahydrofolate cyclo-ligase [Nitrospirae bacterium CG18_big_fil_WC_8_21_14_2_50_70_55]|nr:5-formyltetrahydrofolate cyclo-ligase [Deltaproteobacteria bacterium]OIP63864.1 MAG: 5-formyltetrahydrofolate cyclo-ligase [Nitrospirae bacterium CG2_30_70_394]PIQ06087.1 MAG: 5-formyltetrahydrofolate cyclo-ligase [Nitrospirae bacterium CG18_big_fil_WC_8_21_14_2_50_70_55]PIU79988.1 MAG: 5-formyltetrahydrofolate cyclo-ligase [Nitrospirae bacterium CG06_land_8_20_14_3_00_70_43]PIW83047.1 MAG: 5-formyltetrahydrofolate cyclo-ligase [Nitrospirae bacterium CG_4_8_14_3_um_filter_70_85]PIX82768.1 M
MAKEGGVNKVEWRARLRATRARVAETARAPAAAAVAAHLTASPLWAATTVLAYAASATELSTLPLLHATLSAGKRLVLPRVGAGGDLTLHQIDALEGLVVGYRGLLEPAATAPRVAPAEVELAIIPGVGFDRRGVRLGQGGGHYDRLLAQLSPACRVCGACFACQVVARLPRQAHDRPVAYLLTEEGLAGLREPPTVAVCR